MNRSKQSILLLVGAVVFAGGGNTLAGLSGLPVDTDAIRPASSIETTRSPVPAVRFTASLVPLGVIPTALFPFDEEFNGANLTAHAMAGPGPSVRALPGGMGSLELLLLAVGSLGLINAGTTLRSVSQQHLRCETDYGTVSELTLPPLPCFTDPALTEATAGGPWRRADEKALYGEQLSKLARRTRAPPQGSGCLFLQWTNQRFYGAK
jgi:hypothetical protein